MRPTRPVLFHVVAVGLCAAVPGLVACGGGGSPASPTPASSPSVAPDATIGPAGGTVTGQGGAVRLVIPAGALPTPVGLSIRAALGLPPDAHVASNSEVEITPAGTRFAVPATLSVRFNPTLAPSGVAEREMQLHARVGDAWQAVPDGSTDVSAHEVTALVTSAGSFAARWPGPQGPCAAAQDRQFDFWLGSWSFSAPNTFPGTDDVTLEAGGCLLEERFRDSQSVGQSVSLFSREDGLWHQTYVDNRGTRIVMAGGLENGRMVMNTTASDRFLWETLDARTVRYAGEHSADGGATWVVNFDSRYTRR